MRKFIISTSSINLFFIIALIIFLLPVLWWKT